MRRHESTLEKGVPYPQRRSSWTSQRLFATKLDFRGGETGDSLSMSYEEQTLESPKNG